MDAAVLISAHQLKQREGQRVLGKPSQNMKVCKFSYGRRDAGREQRWISSARSDSSSQYTWCVHGHVVEAETD